jgi:hypothetical protein
LGKDFAPSATSIDFQQSRITGAEVNVFLIPVGSIIDNIMYVSLLSDVPVDPVLALDSVEQFNTIIWAHGGKISAIVCFCHILPRNVHCIVGFQVFGQINIH